MPNNKREAKKTVKIIDEIPAGKKAIILPRNDSHYKYIPRNYQEPVYNWIVNASIPQPDGTFLNPGRRAMIVWHRRAGKDLTCINLIAAKSMQRVGLYVHLFPFYSQGKKIVWNGYTKDGKHFLDAFPGIKNGALDKHNASSIVVDKFEKDMTVHFTNGSIYQVAGADNIDSLVGSNPVGFILSEYSIMSPRVWKFLKPILQENEGWALFDFTPRGKNHAYKLFENTKKLPNWFNQLLTIEDTKAIPLSVIEEERAEGEDEEHLQQEYYCSFDVGLVGAYYSKQMDQALKDGRIGRIPYDPKLPVYTAWDLGLNDTNVIWFFQVLGKEIRVIDFYQNRNEGIGHYINHCKSKPYIYETHFAPWDIRVRDYSTGQSRWEYAANLGFIFETVEKHPVPEGIDCVRRLLSMCYFDENKCEEGIEALKAYQKKYDEDRGVYSETPLHNWASNPADSFRIAAMGIEGITSMPEKVEQETAISEYDPFAA